jgi:hypothetical protein
MQLLTLAVAVVVAVVLTRQATVATADQELLLPVIQAVKPQLVEQ